VKKAVYEASDGAGGVDVTQVVAAMVKSGQTNIPATNTSFGDPAFNHVKHLRIEYTLDDKPLTKTIAENGVLELAGPAGPDKPPAFILSTSQPGRLDLLTFQPGTYELFSAAGKSTKVQAKSAVQPIELAGPWTITFPPNWGAPPTAMLDKLASWTDNSDPGIKYFSGSATYTKDFDIPAALLGTGHALYLDLGSVKNIAEVTLNGTDLGIWWKPPFSGDISAAAKSGKNTLTVRITNHWTNRLIGDEQLPDDSEWNGKPLKRWPQWVLDSTPRPVKDRFTFTTWHHYSKDSPLSESGLLGPVVLRPAERIKVE
jgi:hypothetical protein